MSSGELLLDCLFTGILIYSLQVIQRCYFLIKLHCTVLQSEEPEKSGPSHCSFLGVRLYAPALVFHITMSEDHTPTTYVSSKVTRAHYKMQKSGQR
jgi:hypothetical protein